MCSIRLQFTSQTTYIEMLRSLIGLFVYTALSIACVKQLLSYATDVAELIHVYFRSTCHIRKEFTIRDNWNSLFAQRLDSFPKNAFVFDFSLDVLML